MVKHFPRTFVHGTQLPDSRTLEKCETPFHTSGQAPCRKAASFALKHDGKERQNPAARDVISKPMRNRNFFEQPRENEGLCTKLLILMVFIIQIAAAGASSPIACGSSPILWGHHEFVLFKPVQSALKIHCRTLAHAIARVRLPHFRKCWKGASSI